MGHKYNAIGLRLGIVTEWKSRWFGGKKEYQKNLREDIEIREFVFKKWKAAAIADVLIERSSGVVRLSILTSRPGVLIGRGGTGIEDLTRVIRQRFFPGRKLDLKVSVEEVKRFEENAMLIAQQVAEQIEKRMPFRRILKTMIEQVRANQAVEGVKIEVSGRLGGAEMSRREWQAQGKIPLHTLRADIDFARYNANTTYGVIGVKVWVYKGEKFVIKEKKETITEETK